MNAVIMLMMPLGLPRMVRRRLPEQRPIMFGEASLCSKCQRIFGSYQLVTKIGNRLLTGHRFEDDLALLKRSADAGCHICTKLSSWIASIENGPDWSEHFQLHLSWLFTIIALLTKNYDEDYHTIQFIIHRVEGPEATFDLVFHQLKLKIFPSRGKTYRPKFTNFNLENR
jgi:hypothetical protein